MSAYSYPFLEDEDEPVICIKCGRVGCECSSDCDCNKRLSQNELVQDFE